MCGVGLGPGCVSGTRKSRSWRFSTPATYSTILSCVHESAYYCYAMKCPYSDVIVVIVSQRQQRNIQYFLLYTKVHNSVPQSLQRKPP